MTDDAVLPEYGVRSRSQYATVVHRTDDDDNSKPACDHNRGSEFGYKQVRVEALVAFNRFSLCTHAECFRSVVEEDADPHQDENQQVVGGEPA